MPCSTQRPVCTATQATPLHWRPAMHVAWVSLFPFYFIMVERRWWWGTLGVERSSILWTASAPLQNVLAECHNVFRPGPDDTALWPLTD